jgi:hypothetical protein
MPLIGKICFDEFYVVLSINELIDALKMIEGGSKSA